MTRWFWCGALVGLAACGAPAHPGLDAGAEVDAGPSVSDAGVSVSDAGAMAMAFDAGDPFADAVTRFAPGAGAGFGHDRLPQIVLGPPRGLGAGSGSLDVLSLGQAGVIELEFTDIVAVDGPGPDLVVFENPFSGFVETGVVSVSDDGVTWHEFSCAFSEVDAGYPGCAGVQSVYSSPDNGVSATDPAVSGGDAFDLHDVGLTRARFVRIVDSGANRFYGPPSGGFDLDAVAVVHGQYVLDGGVWPADP